jgi:cell division protein FtsW
MRSAVTILVFCVAALLALGMVMLYSSSMAQVGTHYLMKQLIWCVPAVGLCVAAARTDYRVLRRAAIPLLAFAAILLVMVLVTHKTNGARRWFNFGGIRFQPSELGKIAMIIALAWYGEHFQRRMRTFKWGIVIPGAFIGVMLLLIYVEPDRGTTILMAAVTGAMLVIAGVRLIYFAPPTVLGLTAFVALILNDPLRLKRIFGWLYLEEHKQGVGYQAYQAMVALGAGGLFGRGLGNGRQKLGFVPEHHTDFILSIIGEELGLVATLLVLAAFLVIVICGIYIAVHASDFFGFLLASGLTFLIGLQAFINIGVVTSALPNKGLPLPFISYGGSNLLMMLFTVGLLLSVARRARGPELAGLGVGADDEEEPAGNGARRASSQVP